MSDPKFLVLVSLDEPKGPPETGGYATGGMVSAPSVKVIIEDIIVALRHPAGRLEREAAAVEIASTPMPWRPPRRPPVMRGVGARRPAGAQGPAGCPQRRTGGGRRECGALRLSELMGSVASLPPRSRDPWPA